MGNQRSGCGIRVILALAIAIFGLFAYFKNTQVNPVTGEKQHVALTPQQEIRLGLQTAPEMAQQMGGEVEPGDPRLAAVQTIGTTVVQHSDARNGPWQFEFHLLRDPQTVNAFALPGGQVFITRGLYDKLENESELAGVLGHECGHVIQRHSAQQMAKAQLGQMLVVATGVGASDPEHRGRGQMAAAAAALAAQMTQLHYSRADENESDQWGLQLMTQAGFDPRGMLGVMNVLSQLSHGRQVEMLQTHPLTETRVNNVKEWIAEHYPNGVPGNLGQGKALPH